MSGAASPESGSGAASGGGAAPAPASGRAPPAATGMGTIHIVWRPRLGTKGWLWYGAVALFFVLAAWAGGRLAWIECHRRPHDVLRCETTDTTWSSTPFVEATGVTGATVATRAIPRGPGKVTRYEHSLVLSTRMEPVTLTTGFGEAETREAASALDGFVRERRGDSFGARLGHPLGGLPFCIFSLLFVAIGNLAFGGKLRVDIDPTRRTLTSRWRLWPLAEKVVEASLDQLRDVEVEMSRRGGVRLALVLETGERVPLRTAFVTRSDEPRAAARLRAAIAAVR